ncbi:unnamed protein product [Didymodactylos carnosus]|uniref:Uncharacterized protein n=1 Tax=Didymodactylos carnosus TaxID=1234261 RepID=A0A814QQ90_9BILA|nr:unnamed protein product [Didymodactylos carnosus]CAF3886278.1 unnamed protein product [Didymodactylos carnosus]
MKISPIQLSPTFTNRSGEVSPKRRFFTESTLFFSKERGRNHIVSDFLVQHPSGPLFKLSEDEWKQAVAKYKSLSDDGDVNHLRRTATASINIRTDAYFDNDMISSQSERLFQMLEFKQEYKNNQIEIIVDNARTHTTKAYSLQDFGKNIGTRCPVKQIEYIDENGSIKVIDCYFQRGENKDKTKGLVELCKDLGVQLPDKAKLKHLFPTTTQQSFGDHDMMRREGLLNHSAPVNCFRLESLSEDIE